MILEDLGGDVPAVEVSGLTGKGLDTLTETISTLAEVAELRAEIDQNAEGFVLESQVDKGKGSVSLRVQQLEPSQSESVADLSCSSVSSPPVSSSGGPSSPVRSFSPAQRPARCER